MSDSIFDAFFWIEPSKADPKSVYNSTKVIWHYPDDVSHITKEFRDIPQFCFPDLQKMKLEKAQECRSEHFTFTLTDGEGKRVYGICMRGLFRGVKRRHDVQRRPRHCLCFITRFPFFSAFRSILLQVHAIALLEQHPGSCRLFLDSIYRQCIYQSENRVGGYVKSMMVQHSLVPDMHRDFHIVPPRFGRISNKEVPILPLFEALGIDRFFKLLSAVMCERRVIFIADEVDTLSSSVLAAASMLSPFSWHHIFIPLLPSKLLSYVAAPMPYMMGVRRYLLPELYREALDGVLIVDVDSGDLQIHGDVTIKDLIGDSNTTLKQASEQLDRVRMGMANMFLGKSASSSASNDDTITGGPRDLMAMILTELKGLVASKPGSASIQSVASGLLRGLPGQVKSTEEAKAQWALESEKVLRDNLAYFFVYLFSDLDDFVKSNYNSGSGSNAQPGKINAGEKFGAGDSRSSFDLKALAYRRNQMGDSKALQDFVAEFIHSQMFERFCDEKLEKTKQRQQQSNGTRTQHSNSSASSHSTGSNASHDTDVDDLFESACTELKSRSMQLTVANAKQVVHSRSAVLSNVGNGADTSVNKMVGSNFHPLVLQYTSNNASANDSTESNTDMSDASSIDIELNVTQTGDNAHNKYSNNATIVERICAETYYTDMFIKIMNTIAFRLESCCVSACRGAAGTSGMRALMLLKALLISGAECTLSYALDFLPLIRKLIRIANGSTQKKTTSTNGVAAVQALDFISNGSMVEVRPHAFAVIGLLLDHNKLIVQQRYEVLRKEGAFQFLALNSSGGSGRTREINSRKLGVFGSKQFPSFAALHAQMNSASLPSVTPGVVQVTPPELLTKHGAAEDDDEDGETTTSTAGEVFVPTSANNSSSGFGSSNGAASTKPQQQRRASTNIFVPPVNPLAINNGSSAPFKSSKEGTPKSASGSQLSSHSSFESNADPFSTPFGSDPTPAAAVAQSQNSFAATSATSNSNSSRGSSVSPKRASVSGGISIAPPPANPLEKKQAPKVVDLLNMEFEPTPPASTTNNATSDGFVTTSSATESPFAATVSAVNNSNTASSLSSAGLTAEEIEIAKYHITNRDTGEVMDIREFALLDAAKYRVVNKDTGEVMDIRDIAKLQQKQQQRKQQQLQQQSSGQTSSARIQGPPPSKPLKPKTTDPFSLSAVKSGFADWGSVVTDAFGFGSATSPSNHAPSAGISGGSARPSSSFAPTVATPNNNNAVNNNSGFAPSTSWATTAPSTRPAPASPTNRPAGGVFPSSDVINSGAMGSYGGATQQAPRPVMLQPPPQQQQQQQHMPPNNPFNNMPPPGAPAMLNTNRMGMNTGMQQQPPMMYPPQQPQQVQYHVRQAGQAGPSGAKPVPKDPFSDLANFK